MPPPRPSDLPRTERLELASRITKDPRRAHRLLFGRDNTDDTPSYHHDLIQAFHGPQENVLAMCFRGSAKSTIAERCITLEALSGGLNNALIVGDSYQRAADRLKTIRRHLQYNEWLRYLYGSNGDEVRGETWQEGRLELENGSFIWCAGQGQAIRGTKFGAARPDFLFCDDLENPDNVNTDLARSKLSDWYSSDLIPALDKPGCRRVRVAGTPLHPESLLVKLSKLPDYRLIFIPAVYIDSDGALKSSWPSRFPVDTLMVERERLYSMGKARSWATEYMCEAVNPDTLMFKEEYMHYEPLVRDWHPVYIAYDPARTTKETSSTTGIVAASWVGKRLVIWEARGPRIMPSEVVEDIFRLNDKYDPVSIGVERDGLEQFILEPIRHEQLKRGQLLPIVPLKAPKGKDEFIGRLQPLFAHGDVVFAGRPEEFKEAVEQILSFPVGFKDILNAMAYLPQLRAGEPVYDDTSGTHIFEHELRQFGVYTLAVNAGSYGTTAVLFQYSASQLLVHRDWVSEGAAGQALASMVQEACIDARKNPRVIVPPFHFDTRNSFGLLSALRGVAEARKGGDVIRGREFIRELLRGEYRGGPRVLLGAGATWTRRAMTGGFCWDRGRTEPREGLYCTLMEGLESAIAPAAYQSSAASQRVAYTPDGRAYQTAETEWR